MSPVHKGYTRTMRAQEVNWPSYDLWILDWFHPAWKWRSVQFYHRCRLSFPFLHWNPADKASHENTIRRMHFFLISLCWKTGTDISCDSSMLCVDTANFCSLSSSSCPALKEVNAWEQGKINWLLSTATCFLLSVRNVLTTSKPSLAVQSLIFKKVPSKYRGQQQTLFR